MCRVLNCVCVCITAAVQKQVIAEPAAKVHGTNRKLNLRGKVCGQCEVQLAGLVSFHPFCYVNRTILNSKLSIPFIHHASCLRYTLPL